MSARQSVRFELGEAGATLVSEAKLRMEVAAPRGFICDRPFLIILKRRGAARPYFALWVEDAEVLTRA